jgi:hypothetical protein
MLKSFIALRISNINDAGVSQRSTTTMASNKGIPRGLSDRDLTYPRMQWTGFSASPQLGCDNFSDGQGYEAADLNFGNRAVYQPVVFFDGVHHTPLFTEVGLLSQVVIKLPTRIGWHNFLGASISNSWFAGLNGIRKTERIERSSRFDELLDRFPEFKSASLDCERNVVHYLLIHKLQYERLRFNTLVAIPETRLVLMRAASNAKAARTAEDPYPAIVQARIKGPSLMSLLPNNKEKFRHPCAETLASLMNSASLCRHINWYPENFIWSEKEGKLYYIDSKPSTMFGKKVNDQSLRNLRFDIGSG